MSLPFDEVAEQSVIGAVLLNGRLHGELGLTGADFYQPRHELIWQAIGALLKAGRPVDPVAVLDELGPDARRAGGHGYIAELVTLSPPGGVGIAEHHARIVANHATNRRTIEALQRALQVVEQGGEAEKNLEEAERLLGAVPTRRDADDLDSLMQLDAFVDRDLGPLQWVIPGLLAREERLIVTAGEGVGKSTLIRQFGVCAAAGMAPLSGRPFDPVKVLIVDVENPERMMVDWYRDLRTAVKRHGHDTGGRLWIDRRSGGMDLANPADRRWLLRRVTAVQPDLLVIGPIYKLHRGGSGSETDEAVARGVTDALDEIRDRIGCAIILETHSPKGDGRQRPIEPLGSSLWMRWPEFGIGLRKSDHPAADARRIVDVKHWRGPRAERYWPARIESGGVGLPWVVSQA